MNDSQITAVAIIFVAALGSIMYNNARISDVGKRIDDLRDTVGDRIDNMNRHMSDRFDDMNKHMSDRFADVNRHTDDKFALLGQQLKTMEENIMRILGDHETRLGKLEHPTER